MTAVHEDAGASVVDVKIHDAADIATALGRHRAIAERLLLSALREQESARDAAFLATASHDLSLSLDEDATCDIIQRLGLPRAGSWCIVDIAGENGVMRRLAVVHPDPAKQAMARALAEELRPEACSEADARNGNLAIVRAVGFGAVLVVPLAVRSVTLGAITFVTRENDAPFSPEEISLASDLTDRCALALDNARLHRRIVAAHASADAASRSKSMFLANMSHELRAPLSVIGGYAELLAMGLRGPVTPEQRTDLSRIMQSQQHLLQLIAEVLNFVKSESGRTEFHFAEVPLHVAVNDVADMLEGAVNERGLALARPADLGDAVVWADPIRLRQILVNLVTNAIKYTPPRGGNIELSSTVMRDVVTVQVTDHGPGIPAEKLEAIFEPFVQLDSELANRRGGVGLGLAISRDLARAMHGDLTVESTLGAGSRFTLALRRARGESGQR